MKKNGRKKSKGFVQRYGTIVDESLNYISESRNYIFFMVYLFIFSTAIGFFLVPLSPELSELIEKELREITEKIDNLSGWELIIAIFINNVGVSFLGIVLGTFFGIFPILSSAINGIVVGYVLVNVYLVYGIFEFWKLLPHGIFELPAVFISLGLGLKIGMFLFVKGPLNELRKRLKNSMKAFVTVVIPLLVVAATIEGILITLMG